MSIDSLASKIACHDEKSFELLYQKMNRLVYLVCLSVVKDEHIANDLSQDTFVTVWNKSNEFRGKGYKSWILTIAKNKSINYINKYSRVVPIGEEGEMDALSCEPSISIENKVALKMAIESLDRTDAEIVLLKIAGMKMKEIAEYLNMPRGTASWRYSEAIKKLKIQMEGDL